MAAPTNHDGHKDATDPLLNHLLNLWFGALGHDRQSIGMSDRSYSGSAQPRHTENRGNAPHGDQDEQVPVKTRPFHHLPLRFAHNQPDDQQRKSNLNFKWSNNQTVMMLSSSSSSFFFFFFYSVTHVVIWDSRKMRMKTSSAGTQQAAIIQMGKSFFSPMGLINQPLTLGLVTSTPFGTTSF